MKRASAALVLLVAALALAAPGSARRASGLDGTWQYGTGLTVQISGATGTVTKAGKISFITGTEVGCTHPVGQQIFTGLTGSGSHFTGSFGLLKALDLAGNCAPDTPRAATFELTDQLRVCVANSSGKIDPNDPTLCKAFSRVGGSTTTTTSTPMRVSYLLLVSARADAVKFKGIPGAKLYATSDVQGAGKVDVDPREGPGIVDGTGTIKVRHEFLSDKLPDITMTLKIGDKGAILKGGGHEVVTANVTVTASSVKACKGQTGSVTLTEGPPSMVAVTVCKSSFLLTDGKGPKGADPTNDVQVKVDAG